MGIFNDPKKVEIQDDSINYFKKGKGETIILCMALQPTPSFGAKWLLILKNNMTQFLLTCLAVATLTYLWIRIFHFATIISANLFSETSY